MIRSRVNWPTVLALLLVCSLSWPQRIWADPLVFEPAIDPGVGFNLIAWSGNSGSSWTNAINALYAAGFREVSISPVRRFDNNTGQSLRIPVIRSLTAIEAGVVRAKQLGMRVTLNPFVELSNLPGGQSWRAYFAPLPGSTDRQYVLAALRIVSRRGGHDRAKPPASMR